MHILYEIKASIGGLLSTVFRRRHPNKKWTRRRRRELLCEGNNKNDVYVSVGALVRSTYSLQCVKAEDFTTD